MKNARISWRFYQGIHLIFFIWPSKAAAAEAWARSATGGRNAFQRRPAPFGILKSNVSANLFLPKTAKKANPILPKQQPKTYTKKYTLYKELIYLHKSKRWKLARVLLCYLATFRALKSNCFSKLHYKQNPSKYRGKELNNELLAVPRAGFR